MPKSDKIKLAQNQPFSGISKAQRRSNFLFKRIFTLKSLSRRSCHEPAQLAMPQVWERWAEDNCEGGHILPALQLTHLES